MKREWMTLAMASCLLACGGDGGSADTDAKPDGGEQPGATPGSDAGRQDSATPPATGDDAGQTPDPQADAGPPPGMLGDCSLDPTTADFGLTETAAWVRVSDGESDAPASSLPSRGTIDARAMVVTQCGVVGFFEDAFDMYSAHLWGGPGLNFQRLSELAEDYGKPSNFVVHDGVLIFSAVADSAPRPHILPLAGGAVTRVLDDTDGLLTATHFVLRGDTLYFNRQGNGPGGLYRVPAAEMLSGTLKTHKKLWENAKLYDFGGTLMVHDAANTFVSFDPADLRDCPLYDDGSPNCRRDVDTAVDLPDIPGQPADVAFGGGNLVSLNNDDGAASSLAPGATEWTVSAAMPLTRNVITGIGPLAKSAVVLRKDGGAFDFVALRGLGSANIEQLPLPKPKGLREEGDVGGVWTNGKVALVLISATSTMPTGLYGIKL